MANRFIQAFQQAPWRVQIQRLGLIFMGLVVFGLTAGLYLSITASSYAAGVEAQKYDDRRDEIKRQIADMRTKKADQITSDTVEKRAKDLHFETASQDKLVYLVVPGYSGRQLDIKTSPASQEVKHSLIKPAFTQSLWEFLVQGILLMGNDIRPGGILQ